MGSNNRTAFRAVLSVELARAGMRQRDLAARMGVAPTTLSTWLNGAHPAPTDLAERIERALALRLGALTSVSKVLGSAVLKAPHVR